MLKRYPKMARTGYAFPGQDQDCLKSGFQDHTDSDIASDDHGTVPRSMRQMSDPEIHYGIIASGNQVIKNVAMRDRLRQEFGALCVEMEAAGLMNEFPCLVIRGICDYADAFKNDQWHRYAAATAAAYAKELLMYVSAEQTDKEKPAQQILGM
jgi:nucleoside phosphorylase